MTAVRASRQCHPSGLPPVIRPGHPEDGTFYAVTYINTEYDRTRSLADARGIGQRRSRLGHPMAVEHLHADGTSCLVATYRYGEAA